MPSSSSHKNDQNSQFPPLLDESIIKRSHHLDAERNRIADAQSEHYRGEIEKEQRKSDDASKRLTDLRNTGSRDASTGARTPAYRQASKDYHHAERKKDNLTRDKDNFDKAFRK